MERIDIDRELQEGRSAAEAFERLGQILDRLRKECPWDRKQTMKSLRYLTIEEVHELSEAIVEIESREAEASDVSRADLNAQLKKELGDLAMHILFYCKIAEEEGRFTTADVYNAICDKLVDRHPFVYRKEDYHGESWEQLKMREGRKDVLEGVPDSLPSLVKAVRMQEKVAGMEAKGDEKRASDGGCGISALGTQFIELGSHPSEAAFGDLLFALVDWGRRHGINADDALCGANLRFKKAHSQER